MSHRVRSWLLLMVALSIGGYSVLQADGCPIEPLPVICPEPGKCSSPGPGCTREQYGGVSVWVCWKIWNPTARTIHHCTPNNSSRCSGKIIRHPECAEYSYTEANAQKRRCDNGALVQEFNCADGPERYVRFHDCSC